MSAELRTLAGFLDAHSGLILAELVSVRGSSPREEGAQMLVAAGATFGTIGGGQLEHLAIQRARQLLRDGDDIAELDVPLGPEIGQCCGGRVRVALSLANETLRAELVAAAAAEAAGRPHVYVFGAGHVGGALAKALSLLPLKVHVVDTRPDQLQDLPDGVDGVAVALPEAVVRAAPAGSAFVILTHDHALDFLIAAEALKRPDAAYVGVVGSRTKRARFASWYAEEDGDRAALDRLVLPIGAQGGAGLGDKRPEVIAALAAAEIMVHIARWQAAHAGAKPMSEPSPEDA